MKKLFLMAGFGFTLVSCVQRNVSQTDVPIVINGDSLDAINRTIEKDRLDSFSNTYEGKLELKRLKDDSIEVEKVYANNRRLEQERLAKIYNEEQNVYVRFKRVRCPKEYDPYTGRYININDGYNLIVNRNITDNDAKWLFDKIKNETSETDFSIQLFASEKDFKCYCEGKDELYKSYGSYEYHVINGVVEEYIHELPSNVR